MSAKGIISGSNGSTPSCPLHPDDRHRQRGRVHPKSANSGSRPCEVTAPFSGSGPYHGRPTVGIYTNIAYNSCRNRHCPKCQGAAAKEWLADREADLLPVPYYHMVFTLPAP